MNNINHSWERFTVRERLSRTIVYVISVITFVWSLKTVEIIPEFLYDAPEQMADLFTRMWPIDFAFYPIKVHDALIETMMHQNKWQIYLQECGLLISLFIQLKYMMP